MKNELPTYVINPALAPTSWQGDTWGMRAFPNRSWINSFYLGTVWNFMITPQRIWHELLRPIGRGDFGMFARNVPMLFVFAFVWMYLGVTGRLVMLPYGIDVVADAIIFDEDQAKRAIFQYGMTEPLVKSADLE